MPSENEEDDEEFQIFSKAKHLYKMLLTKGGTQMSLVAFSKIAKIKAL